MKKMKMLFKPILAIVMIAALVLCCVACGKQNNDDNNKNNDDTNKYEGLSDTEYAQALALDGLEETVDVLVAGVGAYTDLTGVTTGDSSGKVELDIMLGDMLIDLIEQSVFGTTESGMDLSFLSNIGLDMEVDSNSEMAQLSVALGLSDTEIVKLLLLTDEENIWAGAPELSDSFLEVNLADMGGSVTGAVTTTPAWMENMDEYLPSDEVLANILNRYLAMAVEEIDDVTRTTETLTLDGLSQELTKLDIKIYEQDALDAVKAVLTAAKDDPEIKTVVENFGTFYNEMMKQSYAEYGQDWQEEDVYAAYTELINDTLNQLPAKAETTDSYIGVILYVDGGHNIVGCSLDMGLMYTQSVEKLPSNATTASASDTANKADSKQEPFIVFNYYTVTQNGQFATIFETADGEFKITGKGTNNNDVITGTYTVTTEGIDFVTVGLKDFSATEDAIKGTVTLKPTEDLMDYAGVNPYGIDDIALELKLNITEDKADVDAKLIGNDAMIVGIALKVAEKAPATIEKPTNTTPLTDQMSVMGLLQDMDFSSVFANLRTAGVPELLVAALESIIPAV